MRFTALAASAVALVALTGQAPTQAADLGYGEPSEHYGSAYEDRDYVTRDRAPSGRISRRYVEKEIIEERYAPDDDAYDDQPLPPPRTRSYRDERLASACTPRPVIRDRLFREGWQDFDEIELRRHVAIVEARRPNGLPYRLSIDRCTGEVLSARPLAPVPGGPYAFGPRRYQGPYYR